MKDKETWFKIRNYHALARILASIIKEENIKGIYRFGEEIIYEYEYSKYMVYSNLKKISVGDFGFFKQSNMYFKTIRVFIIPDKEKYSAEEFSSLIDKVVKYFSRKLLIDDWITQTKYMVNFFSGFGDWETNDHELNLLSHQLNCKIRDYKKRKFRK